MIYVGLSLILFGCLGYSDSASGLGNPFMSVCNAFQAFFPSRGEYDDGTAVKSLHLWRVCAYWFFQYAVLVYSLSIVVAFFGIEFVNTLAVKWRIRNGRSVNIFWDFSNEARWLEKIISCDKDGSDTMPEDDRESIVFALRESKRSWLRAQDTETVQILAKEGWKWLYGAPGKSVFLNGAKRHFFLGQNGHENVAGANALVRSYKGENPIQVYVRVDSAADDNILYAWADKLNRGRRNVEIIVVREEAIVSCRFLWEHPMLDCPGIQIYPQVPKAVVDGRFRLLIIGFGNQGERLMSDSICDAQFLEQDGESVPIEVNVVDRDEASFGWYEGNCRSACRNYGIQFTKLDVEKTEFWDWLRAEVRFNRIIVCTRDDRLNISVAHDISKWYKVTHADTWQSYRKPGQAIVYARVRDALISQYVNATYDGEVAPFMTFGSIEDIYDRALVDNKWWKAAIWVNGLYCNAKDKYEADEKWREAKSFERESSFASAFHQRNLLRLAGYKIVDNRKDGVAVDAPIDQNWEAALTDMKRNCWGAFGRIEHLRWMAFHFVRGVECWCPQKSELEKLAVDGGKRRKVKPNMLLKSEERYVHAALRKFDDLPQVDELFKSVNLSNGQEPDSPLQDKDSDLTYGFNALRKAGFSIRRLAGSAALKVIAAFAFCLACSAVQAQGPVAVDSMPATNSVVATEKEELLALKAENEALRKENQMLRRELISKNGALPDSVMPEKGVVSEPEVEPAGEDTGYWISSKSKVRHNRRCRNYRKVKGRPCGPNDGRPCKACGG